MEQKLLPSEFSYAKSTLSQKELTLLWLVPESQVCDKSPAVPIYPCAQPKLGFRITEMIEVVTKLIRPSGV